MMNTNFSKKNSGNFVTFIVALLTLIFSGCCGNLEKAAEEFVIQLDEASPTCGAEGTVVTVWGLYSYQDYSDYHSLHDEAEKSNIHCGADVSVIVDGIELPESEYTVNEENFRIDITMPDHVAGI